MPREENEHMPRVERKFLGWIVGVVTVVSVTVGGAVGSLLWQLNTQVAIILVDTRNLKDAVAQMQANMTTGTQYRYTSQDAANDRSTYLKMFEGVGDRLSDVEKEYARLRLDFEKHVANGVK